ncbi:hypothetical protein [Haloechinothrix salitolerans]|uniref:ABC-2 type transport system permease protein n=1 Tax=Haloechinothrix salitolerans TaxID=926830 RepID=A0ABW2BSL5_9PSEU
MNGNQPPHGAMAQAPAMGAPQMYQQPMPPGGQPPVRQLAWQHLAERRASFLTQVRVEFRKLAGTISDRILLIIGPVVLIGLSVWVTSIGERLESASDQLAPAVWLLRVAAIVLHAVLIKLIAGEWQHRSAQPTLLVQPSRARYFLAQAVVVLTVWLFCAAAQIAVTFIVTPMATEPTLGYLLDYRPGWVIGVLLLGSLSAVMTALIVSMLIPNAAGALAVYVGVVPVLTIVSGVLPEVFIWIDPLAPAMTLAGLSPVDNPAPAFTSLGLWLGLLALSGWLVSRRDLA